MATYLVTGSAGFIGSRVCAHLLHDGHEVVGIDNLNEAYDPALKQWRLRELLACPGFSFKRMDICDRGALDALGAELPPTTAIINLAARAGVRYSVENPWVYVETNMTGTLNLLELARRAGIPKFVLASTSSLYGDGCPMPYREDSDASTPLSPYAASKKGAEALCHSYHHLHGIDVTVLRYFTVYGPAGRPDMSILRFAQWISEDRPVRIYGDGTQSRDFTYVDDIARGTIAALRPIGYRIINLGSDRPVALMDIVRTFEECFGKRALLEFHPAHRADVAATWADISRARTLLDWQPETNHRDGIRKVVEWYRANRDWLKDIDMTDQPARATPAEGLSACASSA